MITNLEQLLHKRNILANEIKKLQEERKRVNNAISQAKHQEKIRKA